MTQPTRHNGLIRMALMGTAFVTLTIVLIVFQPGSPRHADRVEDDAASVTRVAPSALATVVTATAAEDAAAPVVIPPPPAAPVPRVAPVIARPAAEQPTSMRDMTFVAISNLKTATTGTAPAPGEPGSLLHSVVQRSISAAAQAPVSASHEIKADAAPALPPGTYLVQPGDTLVSIARAHFGDENMATSIFTRNANVMSGPDSLRAGMVLALPSR